MPNAQRKREPWQMTSREFMRLPQSRKMVKTLLYLGTGYPKSYGLNRLRWTDPAHYHRNHVRNAIKDGKPVPPKVLAEYPEFASVEQHP